MILAERHGFIFCKKNLKLLPVSKASKLLLRRRQDVPLRLLVLIVEGSIFHKDL